MSGIASVVADNHAYYLSVPITSGKHHASIGKSVAESEPDQTAKDRETTIRDNIDRANRLAQELRGKFPETLINPSAVGDFPGWEQDDYRFFWGLVIERFGLKVIFADNWQYSMGCAYEFLIAQRSRLPTLSSNLQPIPKGLGIDMIIEAITELGRPDQQEFLRAVAHDLADVGECDEK